MGPADDLALWVLTACAAAHVALSSSASHLRLFVACTVLLVFLAFSNQSQPFSLPVIEFGIFHLPADHLLLVLCLATVVHWLHINMSEIVHLATAPSNKTAAVLYLPSSSNAVVDYRGHQYADGYLPPPLRRHPTQRYQTFDNVQAIHIVFAEYASGTCRPHPNDRNVPTYLRQFVDYSEVDSCTPMTTINHHGRFAVGDFEGVLGFTWDFGSGQSAFPVLVNDKGTCLVIFDSATINAMSNVMINFDPNSTPVQSRGVQLTTTEATPSLEVLRQRRYNAMIYKKCKLCEYFIVMSHMSSPRVRVASLLKPSPNDMAPVASAADAPPAEVKDAVVETKDAVVTGESEETNPSVDTTAMVATLETALIQDTGVADDTPDTSVPVVISSTTAVDTTKVSLLAASSESPLVHKQPPHMSSSAAIQLPRLELPRLELPLVELPPAPPPMSSVLSLSFNAPDPNGPEDSVHTQSALADHWPFPTFPPGYFAHSHSVSTSTRSTAGSVFAHSDSFDSPVMTAADHTAPSFDPMGSEQDSDPVSMLDGDNEQDTLATPASDIARGDYQDSASASPSLSVDTSALSIHWMSYTGSEGIEITEGLDLSGLVVDLPLCPFTRKYNSTTSSAS